MTTPVKPWRGEVWDPTFARLVSCHGHRRASQIMNGTDKATIEDQRAWYALGSKQPARSVPCGFRGGLGKQLLHFNNRADKVLRRFSWEQET